MERTPSTGEYWVRNVPFFEVGHLRVAFWYQIEAQELEQFFEVVSTAAFRHQSCLISSDYRSNYN